MGLLFYDKTTPRSNSEALVFISNGIWKSGIARTGNVTITFLSDSNDLVASFFQWKLFFFQLSWGSGNSSIIWYETSVVTDQPQKTLKFPHIFWNWQFQYGLNLLFISLYSFC